jgi:uracil phosphoribosyltransferase
VAQVVASSHPVVHHRLAALRDVRTGYAEFRRHVRCLAALLAQEATADLATNRIEVATPLGTAAGHALADTIGIVPILRAGLGMAEGVLELFPDAEVWHIGLYRDEQTLQPMEYYRKLPALPRISIALIVDPMLATGGSAVHACHLLKQSGIARMKLIALIAAPEGIERMARDMPDVPIHVAAIDDRLNAVGFIEPGLGDAGDRPFRTAMP